MAERDIEREIRERQERERREQEIKEYQEWLRREKRSHDDTVRDTHKPPKPPDDDN